jgi:hypothetical protein
MNWKRCSAFLFFVLFFFPRLLACLQAAAAAAYVAAHLGKTLRSTEKYLAGTLDYLLASIVCEHNNL